MKTGKLWVVASLFAASAFVQACNYLDADEYLYEVENLNDIWTERASIRKTWAACYGNMMYYSDFASGNPFCCNYDEGQANRDVYPSLLMAQGKFSADNVRLDFWDNYYKGIRKCCLFLEKSGQANDPLLKEGEIEGYQADARFMRAYYYWQLMELYGPFCIVDHTVDYSDQSAYPTQRATMDKCVEFLLSEIDQCIEELPYNDDIYLDDRGRPSKEAAMAMKSRVLLFNASPLVNGNPDYANFVNKAGEPYFNVGAPDEQRWRDAAAAAKELIDLGTFSLFTAKANDGYVTVPLGDFEGNDVEWPNGPAGIDPYRSYKGNFNGGDEFWNCEIIFQASSSKSSYRQLNTLGIPRCYNDSEAATEGTLCATQKMVDQYQMDNGQSITEADSYYNDFGVNTVGDGKYILGTGKNENSPIYTGFTTDPQNAQGVPNRVLNREPRFYATIGFEGRGYEQRTGIMYYSDYRANALDGYIQTDRPSVRSGYQITKWLAEKETGASGNNVEKQFPIFRMAEIYLNYAEALNEYDPSNPDIVKYLNMVRWRSGMPGYEIASQEVNRARIKHERYVEFAFEGKRYFDSRRWKDAGRTTRDYYGNSEGMGGQVYGCDYTKSDVNFYSRSVIDGYVFKRCHYFLPINYYQIANHWGEMDQNPGW